MKHYNINGHFYYSKRFVNGTGLTQTMHVHSQQLALIICISNTYNEFTGIFYQINLEQVTSHHIECHILLVVMAVQQFIDCSKQK